MQHETARLHLSAWTLGQLDGADARAIEEHVGACAECARFARFLEILRDALRAEASRVLVDHPEAEDLARLATDAPELGLDARARLGAHLESCAVCRDAVDVTRSALREAPPTGFWTRARRAMREGRGVLAGIAVGAAAMGFLWVAIAPPATVVQEVELPRTTRTTDGVAEVVLDADVTHVAVNLPVDPWNVRSNAEDFTLTVEVVAAPHRWSTAVRAQRVFDPTSGRIRLRLPREAFAVGSHELVLRAADDDALVHTARLNVRPAPSLP